MKIIYINSIFCGGKAFDIFLFECVVKKELGIRYKMKNIV